MNKKVELYDENMNYIKTFETTEECAEFFNKDKAYINHNLKYRDKIRKDGKWYKIKRIVIDEKQQEIDRLRSIIKEALEILSHSEIKGSLLMALDQVEFILKKGENK